MMDKENSTTLAQEWEVLEGRKGTLINRSEQYARWTVPSVFAENDDDMSESDTEVSLGNVAIGARLVTHLAHKIGDTMFPNIKPFFAVGLEPDAKVSFEESATKEERAELDKGLTQIENAAMGKLKLTTYRPLAIEAISLKIVTGNALIRRLPDGDRVVYNVRDYCVNRTLSGKLLKVLLRDAKIFGSLDRDIQEKLEEAPSGKKYSDSTPVVLYTMYEWRRGKWYQTQAVDNVELDNETSYAEGDFPCLVLTWNRSRGRDYGKGLVEDYAVAFHNIDVMTEALIDLIGIAADVKFLVDPNSSFDASSWNNAARGSAVAGKDGDITTPSFRFAVEVQFLSQAIERLEKELAQAFLMGSSGVREAERVTAEEIRMVAREIESAFGGIYSRLAVEWQTREAEWLLNQINFDKYLKEGIEIFDVKITAGLESLTREGKLDALRLAMNDLQMLDAVPDRVQLAIDPIEFLHWIMRNRTVDDPTFILSREDYQAELDRETQKQEQLMQQQGAVDAAKGAAAQ